MNAGINTDARVGLDGGWGFAWLDAPGDPIAASTIRRTRSLHSRARTGIVRVTTTAPVYRSTHNQITRELVARRTSVLSWTSFRVRVDECQAVVVTVGWMSSLSL